METNPNVVLVKPSRANDELLLAGGEIRLWLDTTFEPEKHAVTAGTVVKCPPSIYFNPEMGADINSNDVDCDMELQEGDKVFWHYLCEAEVMENHAYVVCDRIIYYLLKYEDIFCAERNKEVVMINGWILLSPIAQEEINTFLQLPENTVSKHSSKWAKVEHTGVPVRRYRDPLHRDVKDGGIKVEAGDVVLYTSESDALLQYELHASLGENKKFFRMRRCDIVAKRF